MKKNLAKKIICGSVLSLLSFNALSGAVGSGFSNEHLGDSGNCPNPNVSNPINIATGNKYHKEVVYQDSGNFPLEFAWHYNSRVLDKEGKYRGVWNHTYGQYGTLKLDVNGDFVSLEFVREDGSYQVINERNGLWINPWYTPSYRASEGYHIKSIDINTEPKPNLPASQTGISISYEVHCKKFFDMSPYVMKCANTRVLGAKRVDFVTGVTEHYEFLPSDNNDSSNSTAREPSTFTARLTELESATGETHSLTYSNDSSGAEHLLTITHSNGRKIDLSGALNPETLPMHPHYKKPYYGKLEVTQNNETLNWYMNFDPVLYRLDGITFGSSAVQMASFEYSYAEIKNNNYVNRTALNGYKKYGRKVAGWHYSEDGQATNAYHSSKTYTTKAGNYPTSEMALGDTISNLEHHDLRTFTNRYGKSTTYGYQKVNDSVQLISVTGNATTNCLEMDDEGTPESAYQYSYYTDGVHKNRLHQVNDAKGYITEFAYTDFGRKQSVTKAKGTTEEHITSYTWGTEEQEKLGLVETISTSDLETRYSYFPNNRLKSIELTDKKQTNAPSTTFNTTRTQEYSYTFHDTSEQVLQSMNVTGPGALQRTHLVYDTAERVTEIRRYINEEDYLSTSFSDYNHWGLPQTLVDENGVTTTLVYEVFRGKPMLSEIKVGDANPYEVNYGLTVSDNPDGLHVDSGWELPSKIINPDGSWVLISYNIDNLKDIDYVINSAGERIDYQYNRTSNYLNDVLQVISDLGTDSEVKRVTDAMGRLYQLSTANNTLKTEFNYDLHGNPSAEKKGVTPTKNTSFSYDGLNQLTEIINPDSEITTFGNEQSKLTSVKDAEERTTTYIRNGFGEVLQANSPDTGIIDYYYDLAGNVTKVVKNADTSNESILDYSHDGLKRVLTIEKDSEVLSTYTYDTAELEAQQLNVQGKLAKIENADSIVYFGYTADGKVNFKQTYIKAFDKTLTLNWNFNSQTLKLDELIYPSGLKLIYDYDLYGRVNNIKYSSAGDTAQHNLITNVLYEKFSSQATSISFANGTNKTLTLSGGVYESINVDQDILSQTFVEQEDGLGNYESITTETPSQGTQEQQFTYDNNSRLLTATGSPESLAYTYNKIGDRQSYSVNNVSHPYTYTPLIGGGYKLEVATLGYSQDYNVAGNLIQDSKGWRYSYDDFNRLLGMTRSIGSVSYSYNELSQRIVKQVNDNTVFFEYGLTPNLLAELGSGRQWKQYVYLNDKPVAIIEPTASNAEPGWKVINNSGVSKGSINTENSVSFNYNSFSGSRSRLFAYKTIGSNASLSANLSRDVREGYYAGIEIRASKFSNADFVRVEKSSAKCEFTNFCRPTTQFYTVVYKSRGGSEQKIETYNSRPYAKLKRVGNSVRVLTSMDGLNWSQLTNVSISLPEEALMGVAMYKAYNDGGSVIFSTSPSMASSMSSIDAYTPVVGNYSQYSFSSIVVDGVRVEPESQPTPYYVYTNHLNAPVLITGQNKAPVWQAQYTPFGRVTIHKQTIENNLRLPGQYYDQESGLHYNYFRYYDPSLGRYIQSDPIGLAGGINTYGYAYQNPIMYYDPDGQFAWGIAFAALDLGMQLYQNGGNLDCVDWTDVGLSALGGGLMAKAFKKIPGKEWSHWVPDRYVRPLSRSGKSANKYYKPWVDKYFNKFVNSRFNGNYVSKETHAVTDAFRYKFMNRTWKASNPMNNKVVQQIRRTPGWIPGSAALGVPMSNLFSGNDSKCGCEG